MNLFEVQNEDETDDSDEVDWHKAVSEAQINAYNAMEKYWSTRYDREFKTPRKSMNNDTKNAQGK